MFLEHVSKPKTKQGTRDEDRFPCRTEETQSKACTVKKRKRKKGKARKFPKPCCREKKKKRRYAYELNRHREGGNVQTCDMHLMHVTSPKKIAGKKKIYI